MLRDLRIFRRNPGKIPPAEGNNENLPTDQPASSVAQLDLDSSRDPLITIQEPLQNPKVVSDQETVLRRKTVKTPSKNQIKGSDVHLQFRTPEKPAAKNRFGWVPKNESGSNSVEIGDESSHQAPCHMPPSTRGSSLGIGGGYGIITPRPYRTAGKASSVHSDSSSTQSTPTKSVTKPMNPGFSSYRPPLSLVARTGNFAAASKGIPISSAPPSIVNTVEVPHFELREDPSFWMDHNVQVVIRVRPLNSMERSLQGYNRCLKQESGQGIAWIGQPETRFKFDHVACETVSQEMLFRVAGLPMVENCMSGYNSCMFAFGQTGSGKTYTMLGEIDELEVRPSPDRGMTPRIFEFLFARIRAEEESRRDEKLKYNCKCSFLEIYNEQITDLLEPSSTNLLLREDMQKGVYVENLTEFKVETVSDILKLLLQGASNRKVAATNMNRESSRSHSVFTCVIESTWEKDSTTNLRFARLNLVDLAGSERQKTSGADGDRLKEAASINKSLSTLGHVIMILVDVAHGKQRHVPYRDSRLTFLLQDSLGGNSKTMIIANVSPSICCASETLSTLKFAQRAKLIQNNAVVNEDASGDILALQHQIRLLKEELSVLKCQNISRSLSFRTAIFGDSEGDGCDASALENIPGVALENGDELHDCEAFSSVRISTKQLKSLEATLSGALRREKMADTAIKRLEAEIEQLNRLVRQREEDTHCSKMMLKFREDKIDRMKSLMDGLVPPESYLLEENNALSEEIQLLRARVDRNPEVTRFALENIRLLDQLRRFQDFYEEGERELLLTEVSQLRDQLIQILDGKPEQDKHPKLNMETQEAAHHGSASGTRESDYLVIELKKTCEELEDCRNSLKSCLGINAKLTREINDLHIELDNFKSAIHQQHANVEPQDMELCLESPQTDTQIQAKKAGWTLESTVNHAEEILNLQLELDILKTILGEERSSRVELEERAIHANSELKFANERILHISKQHDDMNDALKDARSIIEALESQQILSINELEELRENNNQHICLLKKQEQELSFSRKQRGIHLEGEEKQYFASEALKDQPFKHSESEDSPLKAKLKRMQSSLEKARSLNIRYQDDQVSQTSHEREMDEVCRQVEAETAEVIVCLQEELVILQQQVDDSNRSELLAKNNMMELETEMKELHERLYLVSQNNEKLGELVEDKNRQLQLLTEDWERLAYEIAEILADGNAALEDASDQVDSISDSFPQRSWIGEQVGRMIRSISERDVLIEELQNCLEDAQKVKCDMEWKLRSLRGATLAITEAQQQESSDKEREILQLTSQLSEKMSVITELESNIELGVDQIRKAEISATVAFMTVNRLYEINTAHLQALEHVNLRLNESEEMIAKKDTLLEDQISVHAEAEKAIVALNLRLEQSEEHAAILQLELAREQERLQALVHRLEKEAEDFTVSRIADDLSKTKRTLNEFKMGVSTLHSCMSEYVEHIRVPAEEYNSGKHSVATADDEFEGQIEIESTQGAINGDQNNVRSVAGGGIETLVGENADESQCKRKLEDVFDRETTILLLRKEIESALDSLKGVQAQMVKLFGEKEDIKKSDIQNRKSIEHLTAEVLRLKTEIVEKEQQFECRLMELENKLQEVEGNAITSTVFLREANEVLELETSDAKAIAVQKTIEACNLLAKFEEVQETMREADIMVNALMAANETAKVENERCRKTESTLQYERNCLISEVQGLQSSLHTKEHEYEYMENKFWLNFKELRNLILVLEDTFRDLQNTYTQKFKLVYCDLDWLKAQIHHYTELARTWLEETWSEIIGKDCAVSVLHLCHMGIFLERITGLNAENSFLHHGLSESNSVIADLREHNVRAKKELEMCSILKGKLLVDINNSFNRITRKEDETIELKAKLNSFEKKILNLQLQEESMLTRSNSMGTELAVLMKELDLNNRNALAALSDQDKLWREKEELRKQLEETSIFLDEVQGVHETLRYSVSEQLDLLIDNSHPESDRKVDDWKASNMGLKKENEFHKEFFKCQTESIMMNMFAKDFELVVLASELEERIIKFNQMTTQIADLERQRGKFSGVIETIKKEMILYEIDVEMEKHLLTDMDAEISLLRKEIEETRTKLHFANHDRDYLSMEFKQSNVAATELKKEMKTLEQECHKMSLKELELEDKISRQRTDLNEKSMELGRIVEELELKNREMEILIGRIDAVTSENSALENKLKEVAKDKDVKSSEVQCLQNHTNRLNEDLHMKEAALESLQDDVCFLQTSICRIQTDLDSKNAEISDIQHYKSVAIKDLELERHEMATLRGEVNSLQMENENLKNEILKSKEDHFETTKDLQDAKIGLLSSCSCINDFDLEKCKLLDKICSLETCITSLQTDLDTKNAQLEEVHCSYSVILKELDLKSQVTEIQTERTNTLKTENDFLKNELMALKKKDEIIDCLSFKLKHCSDLPETVDVIVDRIFHILDNQIVILAGKILQETSEHNNMASKFVDELELLEFSAKELMSEKLSLQSELMRKDEISKGLLFDLSLLQESASITKDQKDDLEEMAVLMESLENELESKSSELEEAVAQGQMLEAQLHEKIEKISTLELELAEKDESLNQASTEKVVLKADMEHILGLKNTIQEELRERTNVTKKLEEKVLEMSTLLGQRNHFLEDLQSDLTKLADERDHLDSEVLILKEQLEMAQALADENEAIASESRQIAEGRKAYAEDKEEEVKLLERSVEELECTVNVLENKVEIVKGEAERQRLQREEIEMELQAVRHQMLTLHASGSTQNVTEVGRVDFSRHLEEKVTELLEVQKKIQFLQKEVADKDAEIVQCKTHISELNMHAEAQAQEYKHKFKELEAMAEQVKAEPASSNATILTAGKSEKNAAKSRGSGSPFKCIGLGLTQQINSEKDEELSAGRLRIEELEALAASRQKEIFMLNTRLAAAESMTHDVIRDLLGVKLDMSNYASLLDHQQVQKVKETEETPQLQSEESQEKEQEVFKLKKQLKEFIEERQNWLDEINRRHSEMMAARIASEKLQQRVQFLTTENEMLKADNSKHKKMVMELEDEVKKFSSQTNLQQRIHHHAKIKEENNLLKIHNEDLNSKLRHSEAVLSRVKEELAHYRASSGRNSYVDFDEEEQFKKKLDDSEEERVQMAQKLLSLCTSILKAAGITRPVSNISPSMAEDALNQLKERMKSLESELQDLKLKSKISSEKIRLTELRRQSSPLSSRTNENWSSPRSMSQSPLIPS